MKFRYVPLGQLRLQDDHGSPVATDRWIYRVEIRSGVDYGRVIGLVQENPSLRNVWLAVPARDGVLPAVDYRQGLCALKPGRGGWGSKREAAVWLAGTSDAQQGWFWSEEK